MMNNKWTYHFELLMYKLDLKIGNYASAEARITNLVQENPKDTALLSRLQRFYQLVGDSPSYMNVFEKADLLYTDKLNLNNNFANALMESFEYSLAVPKLKYVLSNLDEKEQGYRFILTNLLSRLAICYIFLNSINKAREEIHKIDEVSKEGLDSTLAKILLLVYEQKPTEIIATLDQYINNYAYISAPYFWKAIYYQYWQNNLDEALFWYEKAINKLNTINEHYSAFHAFTNFANPEMIIQQYINASALANQLIDAEKTIKKANLQIDDFDHVYMDMYLAMMRGEYDIVEKECRNQIARKNYKGMAFEYWLLLAQCYLNQNRISEGFESIENALKWNPTYYEALGVLGSLHIKNEDWQAAKEVYIKRSELLSLDFRNWKILSECYQKLGEVDMAKQAHEKALQINPITFDII